MDFLKIFVIGFTLSLNLSLNHCNGKIMRRFDGYYGLRKDLEDSMTYKEQVALRGSEREPKWIEQPLDHFNVNNNRTWKMKYYSNLNLFKPGGPIVIFIGGEFNITAAYVYGGITYDLASDTNGAMFATEHRYYGESIPIQSNFEFLNSEQGLADLVTFINKIKAEPDFAESKVVVIGGSYPGILATRLRQFHSDLVDAAVASSAPLLAKVDFYEFIDTVSDVFRKYGTPNCINIIKNVFHNYIKCFEDPICIEGLVIEKNLCDDTDLRKRKNQFSFIATTSYKFDNMVQYGTVTSIKEKCQKLEESKDIEYSCDKNAQPIHDSAGDVIDSESEDDGECISVDFFQMVENWKEPWTYQTCNEFGYFVTTYSDKEVYGHKMPLKAFLEVCSIAFGIKNVQERVRRTNEKYGGLRPNVTRVVFTNGGLDPWHRLGLTESFSDEVPVIFIPEASHTKDLATLFRNESAELIEARDLTKSYIRKWIGL